MRKVLFLLFLFVYLQGSDVEIPLNTRLSRQEFLSSFIQPDSVGAEIGVMYGAFAYHFLLSKNPKKLYLIDPWCYRYEGKRVHYETSPEILAEDDILYEKICRLFEEFENVEILRLRSEDAVAFFEDEFFDYVYIDGEHTFKAVLNDLTLYLSKVKIGGYLIGDDYGWTGIAPAVHKFLAMHRKQCKFIAQKEGQYIIKRIK